MRHLDHISLIRQAIPVTWGVWADLGSGEGAFTLALADILPEKSIIYSIDKDPASLEIQRPVFQNSVSRS